MKNISFALAIGPLGPPFVVTHAVRGEEGISRLYRFDLEVGTFVPEALFQRFVLGHDALLAMRVGDSVRLVHGRIVAVRTVESRDEALGFSRYRLELAPSAWALKRRHDSRVFQNMSVDEILKAIAEPLGLALRIDLATPLPKREYTTQFDETDFEFFARLCAENALLYYFEQPPTALGAPLVAALAAPSPVLAFTASAAEMLRGAASRAGSGETIVVTDRAAYLPIAPGRVSDIVESAIERTLYSIVGGESGESPAGPTVPYRAAGALVGDVEAIHEFSEQHKLRSTKASYREYDPDRPMSPLDVEKSVIPAQRAEDPIGALIAAGPSPSSLLSSFDEMLEDERLQTYFHEGRDLFPDWDHGKKEPARALLQLRRTKETARGKSDVVRLVPGHTFKLEEYPVELLNSGWVVTAIRHEGTSTYNATSATVAYENAFECVPSDVAFVPARPRRRVMSSYLTATVVGPKDQEIHVDDQGRIKVKFHWDRGPELAEPTCWIRVMQSWGGTGWGTQFIPRVGMEAVVAFEDGDPDKPLVLGCVYNRVLPTPFRLPEDKTRSGWRTRSSPESSGFNELSFEDRANSEQIYLKAQRDLDAEVGRNRTAVVAVDDVETVGRNQRVGVEGDQHIEIHGDRRGHVRSSDHLRVSGGRDEHVGGLLSISAQDRNFHAQRDDVISAGRNLDLASRTAFLTTVGSTFIDACENVDIVASERLILHGDHVSAAADTDVVLSAGGGAFIRITKDTIQLSAPTIRLNAKDAQLVLKDGKSLTKVKAAFQVVSDDKIILKSSGASLGLGAEAKLDGSQVLLNSPSQATDNIETEQEHTSVVAVADPDGEAIPGALVVVTGSDGGEFMGRTDENGQLTAPVEGSATVTFPDLSGTSDQ